MTQDEIIEMARQAGFIIHEFQDRKWVREPHTGCDLDPNLETFAKLVAAKEREACAKVCDDLDKSHWGCEVKATWCSEAIRARGEA